MEAKSVAVNGLKSAFRMFGQDLEALPESAFDQKFGPKTRTVADIVHEVNLVNDHIGLTIRGEPLFEWPDGWIVAPEGLRSKDAVIAAHVQSSKTIIEMVEGFSEADLERKVETERGPTTVFERCRFMTFHVHYHSGQLNFIQTLVGDDGWHWS